MIRPKAEWEKQKALIVVFPHEKTDWSEYIGEIQKAYVDFIACICEFEQCIVICDEKNAKKLKPHKNLKTIHVNTNDTWIRDFGGIDVEQDGKILTYDFTFNAWGGKFNSNLDNKVTKILFEKGILKGEFKSIDFILEGGSIDTNGKNAMLTTSKCIYNENRNSAYSREQIKQKICKLFGIEHFICLNHGYILGDDTDSHIDILARFIDENTIAYVTCEQEDEHYNELKKMQNELEKTSFNLLALPLPKPMFYKQKRLGGTYINFVFVNGGLIVPTYNQKSDEIALNALQKALPHVKIKGVDASVFIRQNGSLHCSCINKF